MDVFFVGKISQKIWITLRNAYFDHWFKPIFDQTFQKRLCNLPLCFIPMYSISYPQKIEGILIFCCDRFFFDGLIKSPHTSVKGMEQFRRVSCGHYQVPFSTPYTSCCCVKKLAMKKTWMSQCFLALWDCSMLCCCGLDSLSVILPIVNRLNFLPWNSGSYSYLMAS